MTKKKWIAALTAVIVLGITATLYLQSRPAGDRNPQAGGSPSGALTFKVVREDLTGTVEVKGKSSYRQETYVNAPFSADVKGWSVTDGAQVKKGDVLFQLDGTAMEDELAQLEVNMKKQESDIQLADFQASIGSTQAASAGISETEAKQRFAEAESRRMQQEVNRISLEHSRRQYAQKTEKLKSAVYKAPEDGIFLFNGTKQPQSLKENERVGKIVDLTKLQLICMVGEYDLFRIKTGMPAQVKVDALKDVKLKGQVERLSKFAKMTSSTDSDTAKNSTPAEFEVVITLEPNDQLIADLSLTATIMTESKSGALVVPTLTVQQDKDGYYVMTDNGAGTAQRRDVKIGLQTPEKTEITEGLSEGETVVLQ
ncbi:efflux RND transporter periplasmic adaptor subunit [Paenibacillus sp. P26]|nr:efflux RND transporter periplasmic adaptor subunit [Paenibacillus sp. P26]UUZ93860.1 efflux RND transporter periplasmic adaptor subunit [Paenibacillus sp. P25]